MKSTQKVIWLISKYAVTPDYGNATAHYHICKHLAKKDFDVTLISSQSSNIKVYKELEGYFKYKIEGNLKSFLLKGPKISKGFSFLRIWSWIIFEWYALKITLFNKQLMKPDVIIISSLSLLTILTGVVLKWRYNTKLILEIRDIWPLTLIEIGGYSKYNPFVLILRIIEKIGYSLSDVIIGTMPNLQEHVRETIMREKTVYCVPQGYDSGISVNELSDISKKKLETINLDEFSVVYSGTIGKANNIDLILDTAAKLMEIDCKIHFYLVGDGPLKSNYLDQFSSLNNLTFIEPVPHSDLPMFLSNFDLLICPIKKQPIYKFGISPQKVVDYMRSGRPILFSYDGFPSFVDMDKFSFTISADDSDLFASKLEEIIGMSEETLSAMGRIALSTVEKHHSFDYLSDKYKHIINEL